jgi:hypothetical protein
MRVVLLCLLFTVRSSYVCSHIVGGWHLNVYAWFSLFSGSDGAYCVWSVGWSMGERIIMVGGAVIATLGYVIGPSTEGTKV